ncbi:nuclease-related domain-containing protein [Pseudoneobacillus sp. C159]
MIELKARTESDELLFLRYSNSRTQLTADEVSYLHHLEKGFAGEKRFDELAKGLTKEWLFVNDLLMNSSKSTFQTDAIGIPNDRIHVFEVKNNEDDYYYDNGEMRTIKNDILINNPFDQVKRIDSLLRRLLHDLGLNYSVETHLIFVNPEFTLLQAPKDLSIIYPTQIPRFFRMLNSLSCKTKDKHYHLAEKLMSLHIEHSPYVRRFDYPYHAYM